MKRILITLSLALLLCTSDVLAQWSAGVRVGYDVDFPVVNTQYAYSRNYSAGSGSLLAVPVQYNFLDWVGILVEPGLQYRKTGYAQANLYEETMHDLYLEIPLMANFSFGGTKVRGFLNLGGYIGGWLAGWRDQRFGIQGGEISEDVSKRQFTNQDCRFDAGLVGGIGLRWLNNHKVSMSFEYRYYYDCVSSMKPHKVGTYDHFDNLHTFTIGVHFNFGTNLKGEKGYE